MSANRAVNHSRRTNQ